MSELHFGSFDRLGREKRQQDRGEPPEPQADTATQSQVSVPKDPKGTGSGSLLFYLDFDLSCGASAGGPEVEVGRLRLLQ